MAYKIYRSPNVEIELEEAYSYYYNLQSNKTLLAFDNEIEKAFSALESNPFYQVRYKNVRALPLKKFPFIFFLL